jgi:hypothetical protein
MVPRLLRLRDRRRRYSTTRSAVQLGETSTLDDSWGNFLVSVDMLLGRPSETHPKDMERKEAKVQNSRGAIADVARLDYGGFTASISSGIQH